MTTTPAAHLKAIQKKLTDSLIRLGHLNNADMQKEWYYTESMKELRQLSDDVTAIQTEIENAETDAGKIAYQIYCIDMESEMHTPRKFDDWFSYPEVKETVALITAALLARKDEWLPRIDYLAQPTCSLPIVRTTLDKNSLYFQDANGDIWRLWFYYDNQPMVEKVAFNQPLPNGEN